MLVRAMAFKKALPDLVYRQAALDACKHRGSEIPRIGQG